MKKPEEDTSSPLKGSLSMFSMDLASKGLSWAGNVYQKWENICFDNIIGQDPSSYVDAFGEHLRKFCEEVAEDWHNPFVDSCVKGPVSDLSVEHDVIAKVCKKYKTGPVEHLVNDASSILLDSQPIVSSGKCSSHALTNDISEDASCEEACDMFNKKSTATPAEAFGFNCSYETNENLKEVADPVASVANNSDHLASADTVLPCHCPGDEAMDNGLMLSSCAFSTEVNGCSTSQEGTSLMGSFENVEQQSNLDGSLSIMEITVAECSGGFDGEKTTEGSNSDDDEYEDVRLDNFLDGTAKNEIALIPCFTIKKMSYKKILRDAIASKVRLSKKKNEAANWFNSIDMDAAKRDKTTFSRKLSTQEPLESDWELL